MSSQASLNPQQRQAVEFGPGPLLIIAGPGTGKTKTLTARIVQLLGAGGIHPKDILALTFTNKAAGEMRERVISAVGPKTNLPAITTFHALCRHLLQKEEKVELISEPARAQLIKELYRDSSAQLKKEITLREASLYLSRAKAALQPPVEKAGLAALLTAYNTKIRAQGLRDFDDLLRDAYELLRDQPGKRPGYRYVLVDEFQDTNELQYELLRVLAATSNFFVIGDPQQSIYAFRGAGAEVFSRFRADFPDHTSITLATNYRSVPEVVKASNAVFAGAPALHAHRAEAGAVQSVQVLNEYGEAAFILDTIERRIGGSDFSRASSNHDNVRLSDFAVLYRTHHAAKTIRQRFADSGIPYQIVGEGAPFERSEIQTIIAVLRCVREPREESHRRELSLLKPFTRCSPNQLRALLRQMDAYKNEAVSEIIRQVMPLCGFDGGKLALVRDLEQFIGTVVRFGHDLGACLGHLDALAESEFYDPAVEAVTLSTIHAAKGLEFGHVFVCAAEDGLLPVIRKTSPVNIEEEKRLFYVALTRARDTLDILYTKTRSGQPATPSPFVTALPSNVLPRTIDPAMAQQQRRLHLKKQKRSQSSLF